MYPPHEPVPALLQGAWNHQSHSRERPPNIRHVDQHDTSNNHHPGPETSSMTSFLLNYRLRAHLLKGVHGIHLYAFHDAYAFGFSSGMQNGFWAFLSNPLIKNGALE